MVTLTAKTITPLAGALGELSISPDEKFIFPNTTSGTPYLMMRNDATGNYDSNVPITGAPAVNIFCSDFTGNSQRVYWASANVVYWAVRTGNTWAYGGSFAAVTTVRSMASSPDSAYIGVGSTNVEVFRIPDHTRLANDNVGDYAEDMDWNPSSTDLIVLFRSGGQVVYPKTGTFPRTLIPNSVNQGNWCIAMHPTEDEYVASTYLNAPRSWVYKKISGVWTKQPQSIFSDGGFDVQSLSVQFFSGGQYIKIQQYGSAAYRVYKRSDTAYTLETATGYTGRSATYGRGGSTSKSTVMADVLDASPWLAVHAGPPVGMYGDGILTSPKAKVEGALKYRFKLNAAINAPVAKTAGDIKVPTAVLGAPKAPSAKSSGIVAVADNLNSPTYFEILAAQAGAYPERVTFVDQAATRRVLYSVLTAPKAKTTGILTQGRVVLAELKAPQAASGGYVQVPLFLTSALAAPKAVLDSHVDVPISGVVAPLHAPKATTAGELQTRYHTASALTAARAKVVGQIGNFYLSMAGKAPKAVFIGAFDPPVRLTSALSAPAARVTGLVTRPGAFHGELNAPAAKAAGVMNLDTRTVKGEFAAPKSTVGGEVIAEPGVFAALSAPHAKIGSVIDVAWGTAGTLTAPRAKFDGLALRYVRVDANIRAPKAKTVGLVTFPNGGRANWIAPKAHATGALELRFKITSDLVAPKATAEGALDLRYKVTAPMTAPKAGAIGYLNLTMFADGEMSSPPALMGGFIGVEGSIVGEMKALAATLAGELDIALSFHGVLSAPVARIAGTLELFTGARSSLLAPAAISDGLLDMRNSVEGIGSAPASKIEIIAGLRGEISGTPTAPTATVEGNLRSTFLIGGDVSAPKAAVDGVLGLFEAGTVTGELVAPRATADGLLNNVTSRRRRNLTIIRR